MPDATDIFTQALEIIAQVMRDDTEGCLDRDYKRWQHYGFHLTIARHHLDALPGKGMAPPPPGERDVLADAAIHVLRALTLREAH
jgi:hypothetical protein